MLKSSDIRNLARRLGKVRSVSSIWSSVTLHITYFPRGTEFSFDKTGDVRHGISCYPRILDLEENFKTFNWAGKGININGVTVYFALPTIQLYGGVAAGSQRDAGEPQRSPQHMGLLGIKAGQVQAHVQWSYRAGIGLCLGSSPWSFTGIWLPWTDFSARYGQLRKRGFN